MDCSLPACPSTSRRRQASPGRAALAALMLAAASPAVLAQVPTDPQVLQAQLERIDTLRGQRPNDGLLVFYRAMTLAGLQRRDEAMADLRSLQGRRLGLVPAAGAGFDALWADPAFQQLRQALADDEARTPHAPLRWELPGADRLPEGIAFDAASGRGFIGSVAGRRVEVIERDGRVRPFSRPSDRLDAVLGLHVDARRRELLVVSTSALSVGPRRNEVLRYPLDGRRPALRIGAPDAGQLNDVVALADGSIVATDSRDGRLWRARRGTHRFEPMGERGSVPAANGIAAAPDGTLYVAIASGVMRVDAAGGPAERLPQPDDLVSGCIDGLYWHEGALVGIQNVTNPGRVVRLELADGGRRIAGLRVLQSHHHPRFEEPTTGAIAGDVLLVIANSHIAQLGPDGRVRDPQALQPTRILAVPLRPAGAQLAAMAAAPAPKWPLPVPHPVAMMRSR